MLSEILLRASIWTTSGMATVHISAELRHRGMLVNCNEWLD